MRFPLRMARIVPLAALLALGAGCGAGHDALVKEVAELRAEVTRLRAAQGSLAERVDGIEIARGAWKGAPSASPSATPAPSAVSGDRPDLSVVRLSPSEGDGDADSDSPRPVIRAVGGDGSIHKGDAKKAKDALGPKKGASPKKAGDAPTVKP